MRAIYYTFLLVAIATLVAGAPLSTDAPTFAPTATSTETSEPTFQPTAAATSAPSSAPTHAPTDGLSEHVVVHLYDTHGDGWRNNLFLKVNHGEGETVYSLECSCRVVRIFSGDISLSIWRNRTIPGPKGDMVPYEWEALWTIGYSDGLAETSYGIYGDVDTEVDIDDYEVVRVRDALDVDESKPSNMCVKPKPKPKVSPASNDNTNTTSDSDDASTEPSKPSPTVDVRLALMGLNDGESWCDDSGDTTEFACSTTHWVDSDATLPNLLTYPRYYISRTDDNRIVASGTLRTNETEWVTSVRLLREGSYVFSVSGSYTLNLPDRRKLEIFNPTLWDFCGEQGGLNERLHFNMVKSVCHAHYIEELDDDISCDETPTGHLLATPVDKLKASSSLQMFRNSVSVFTLVGAACVVVALVFVVVTVNRKNRKFARLDTTEHA